jgi:hypothetical protein
VAIDITPLRHASLCHLKDVVQPKRQLRRVLQDHLVHKLPDKTPAPGDFRALKLDEVVQEPAPPFFAQLILIEERDIADFGAYFTLLHFWLRVGTRDNIESTRSFPAATELFNI